MQKIKDGEIVKHIKQLHFITATDLGYQIRCSFGSQGLNWNLFKDQPSKRIYFNKDYNWRWYDWDYGTGEAGNNATHELDIARWALGVNYPNKVDVYRKYHYLDDGWTMYDTMEAKFKFSNGKMITWDDKAEIL